MTAQSVTVWAAHTDTVAINFSESRAKQTIGMITSQFKIKLRMQIATAAQLSAEVMPS